MAIYAIISPSDAPPLEAAINEHFEGNFFKVAPGQFVVSTQKSTDEVSQEIGLKGGKLSVRAMIVRVENYAGWHSKDLWEWMAAKAREEASGTAS